MYQGYYYHENQNYQESFSDDESEGSLGQTVHFKDEPEELHVSGRTEEPPWVEYVQGNGELFYIEPFNEVASPPELISLDQLQLCEVKDKPKDKAVLQKLGSVKRIFPTLKRDKNAQNTENKNLKNISSELVDGVDGNRMPGKCVKKDVSLIVIPPKKASGKRNDLEGILGIIPGKEKRRKTSQSEAGDLKICIKGFVPDGPALQSGELKIGDTILSLNKLDLNISNVGTILSAITGAMEITLTIQRFIPSSTRLIPRTVPTKNDNHLIKLISGDLNTALKPDVKSVPHALLYLALSSSEDDTPDKDVLYQYPRSVFSKSLLGLRGVFLTLSDLMVSVTGSAVESSTFLLNKKLVHVGYSKLGHHIMVVALPADRISIDELKKLVGDVTRILCVIFGSLDRAFCEKGNKVRLDHLFVLLFEHLLSDTSSCKFYNCLPGVRWLDLPTTTQMQLNCCLNDLEAADYGELADEYFHIRREYTILGSSVFYKGHLVANHLPTDDLYDIALYCKYYCLLTMSEEHCVGQLIIWKEIFLTRRLRVERRKAVEFQETKGRWFLLVIGQKNWLYCVLLEAGGVARRAEGYPGPDHYYIEQVKDSLLQIESLDIPAVCDARLQAAPVPPLASSDCQMLSRAAAAFVEKSKLGVVSPDLSQFRKYSSLESLRLPGDEVDSSDSGSLQSSLQRKGSDSSGSVSSLGTRGKSKSYRSNPSLTSAGILRKSVSDSVGDVAQLQTLKLTSGLDNTLFQYVSFNSLHGVIVCPTANDNAASGGAVHQEVVTAFHNSCLVIRRMFQPYYKQRLKMRKPNQISSKFASVCALQNVIEHGVQFHRKPEKGVEQKKSPPVLRYWVIGRLFLGEHPRELYVCYHHGLQQSAVELAFKLCFGTPS